MRYLAQIYKPSSGEALYNSSKSHKEQAYEIDTILEFAADLKAETKFMDPNDPSYDDSLEAM